MKRSILLVAVVLMMAIFAGGCFNGGLLPIKGEGEIVSETFNYSDFDEIALEGAFDIVLTQGDQYEVVVEGQQNIIDRMDNDLSGDKLTFDLKRGNYRDYDLTIFITMPNLSDVDLSGSGDIRLNDFEGLNNVGCSVSGSGNIISNGTIYADNIALKISGSGKIDFAATATKISTNISGSGDVYLEGSCTEQNIDVSGSGKFECFNLISQNVYVDIAGSGNCNVYADNVLDVKITGSGDVNYKGNPQIDTKITGSGNVHNKN